MSMMYDASSGEMATEQGRTSERSDSPITRSLTQQPFLSNNITVERCGIFALNLKLKPMRLL
jgi:hypothetical protein